MNYFEELRKVDVSKYVEKKGQFSYLSWAWAVDTLGLHHPEATWEVHEYDGAPYMYTGCGYFVKVTVTVPVKSDDGYQFIRKTQIHPVLDHRNKPIDSPNAFDINTSIQRCLAKAIALHGLSLYIYQGEDLPLDAPPYTAEQKKTFDTLLETGEGLPFWLFLQTVTDEAKVALMNSFEKGQITKNKDKCRKMETEGSAKFAEYVEQLIEHIEEGDFAGLHEIGEELGNVGKSLAFKQLSPELQAKAREMKQ